MLAFGRILRESSAYYLLGVAPAAEDRDGKLHVLRVTVKKRGVTVRTRTHVVILACRARNDASRAREGAGATCHVKSSGCPNKKTPGVISLALTCSYGFV